MSAAERLNDRTVLEVAEGSPPITITAFNRPIGVIVPYADYVRQPTAPRVRRDEEPNNGEVVRLDAHAHLLAKEEAERRDVRVSVVVSDCVRTALQT